MCLLFNSFFIMGFFGEMKEVCNIECDPLDNYLPFTMRVYEMSALFLRYSMLCVEILDKVRSVQLSLDCGGSPVCRFSYSRHTRKETS